MCLHLVILIDVFTIKAKLFISKRKTNSVLPTDCVIPHEQSTHASETPPTSCLNIDIGDIVSFSTGFITCFLHTVALVFVMFLISRVKQTFSIAQDPRDWEVSLISKFVMKYDEDFIKQYFRYVPQLNNLIPPDLEK